MRKAWLMALIAANIIFLWASTNASIPSGWTRETALDAKYPRGSANAVDPGGTGGALTHTHTQSHDHTGAHTHTIPTSSAGTGTTARDAGTVRPPIAHTHTAGDAQNPVTNLASETTATTSADNNEPAFFTVIFIKSNGSPTGIPVNAVGLWNTTTAPTGWNLCDAGAGRPDMRGAFLKGAAAAGDGGSSGGAATHTHANSAASHSHGGNYAHAHPDVTSNATASGGVGGPVSGANAATATLAHTHVITVVSQATAAITANTDGASGSGGNEPPYVLQGFIQNNNAGVDLPIGIIGIWGGTLATIPANWNLCLTGDAEVSLADGSKRPIQKIVEEKQAIEVLAYNEQTGAIEGHRVVGWSKRKSTRDEWIRFKIAVGNGHRGRSITVTREHPVWIDGRGWLKADEIHTGDKVLIHQKSLNTIGRQAIIGSWLGDGSLSNSGRFSICHGKPQSAYIEDTAEKLQRPISRVIQSRGYGVGRESYQTRLSLRTLDPELETIMRRGRAQTLNELGAVGLAYWYMDDGNLQSDSRQNPPTERVQFHTEGFNDSELAQIIEWFDSAHGIKATAYTRNNTEGKITRLNREGSEKLFALIAPYIHPSMRYKLPRRWWEVPYLLQGICFFETRLVPRFITRKDIRDLNPSKRNLKMFRTAYDLSIDGAHSFVANNFVVHNCNGGSGTPDLRSKYVKGATTLAGVGGTGGSTTHNHTGAGHTHAVAAHTHTLTHADGAGSNETAGAVNCSTTTHTHTWGPTGSSSLTSGTGTPTIANNTTTEPPYYDVAYIQYAGAGASYAGALDTSIEVDVTAGNVQKRLRIGIENTDATTAGASAYKVRVSKNGGAYADVTASSSNVKTFACANFADGDDVAQLITSGTYQTDNNAAEESTGAFTLTAGLAASTKFETEIALEFISADLANGDSLDFRITQSDGTVLDTYTVTANATITKSGAAPTLRPWQKLGGLGALIAQ